MKHLKKSKSKNRKSSKTKHEEGLKIGGRVSSLNRLKESNLFNQPIN